MAGIDISNEKQNAELLGIDVSSSYSAALAGCRRIE
jgi:hypothetical protein